MGIGKLLKNKEKQEQDAMMSELNEKKAKIEKLAEGIKQVVLEQDVDVNLFTVVVDMMKQEFLRDFYNTKISELLEKTKSDAILKADEVMKNGYAMEMSK